MPNKISLQFLTFKSTCKMKLSLGIFLLAFVGASVGQEPTITEDLRAAQTDLTVGHEFAETLLSLNRGQISAYMHVISRALIDSHINAYSHMKDQILETNATLDAIVVTEQNEACMNSVWNRWNLQTARSVYGSQFCNKLKRFMSIVLVKGLLLA